MRFSLLKGPGLRPLLCIGNDKSKVFFWDLQSLEEYVEKEPPKGKARAKQSSLSATATPSTVMTEEELRSASQQLPPHPAASSTGLLNSGLTVKKPKSHNPMYSVDDPFVALQPHKTHVVPKVNFAARQAAWSVGGEWCVVVGDQGMIVVMGR